MYVCVFTRLDYGTSGNELPPPVIGGASYAVVSKPKESFDKFSNRMHVDGMALRKHFDSQKPEPYSWTPAVSWSITKVVGGATALLVK